MRTYFLQHGTDREGPYSLNDLHTLNIAPTTRIWTEGMPGPAPASFIPELKGCIVVSEPVSVTPAPAASQLRRIMADGKRLRMGSIWKTAGLVLGAVIASFYAIQRLSK